MKRKRSSSPLIDIEILLEVFFPFNLVNLIVEYNQRIIYSRIEMKKMKVKSIWKSPFLFPTFSFPTDKIPKECVVVIRFHANLEKLNRKGKCYPEDLDEKDLDKLEIEMEKTGELKKN